MQSAPQIRDTLPSCTSGVERDASWRGVRGKIYFVAMGGRPVADAGPAGGRGRPLIPVCNTGIRMKMLGVADVRAPWSSGMLPPCGISVDVDRVEKVKARRGQRPAFEKLPATLRVAGRV